MFEGLPGLHWASDWSDHKHEHVTGLFWSVLLMCEAVREEVEAQLGQGVKTTIPAKLLRLHVGWENQFLQKCNYHILLRWFTF